MNQREVDELRSKLSTALDQTQRAQRSAYLLRCALDRVLAWSRAPMTTEQRAREWSSYVLPAIEEAIKRSAVASQ